MRKLLFFLLVIPVLSYANPLNDIQQLDTPCKKQVVKLLLKHGYINKETANEILSGHEIP